ncbi:MAG: hypothetical protein CL791_05955 [Chloroflexi bacterium]|nr:hypothetical protein [Chloroflexota bacterium]
MSTLRLTIQKLENALKSHSMTKHEVEGSRTLAAVTVLFTMNNQELSVLMIKRAEALRNHSGQWAFPGGMIEDSDKSSMHAALRETNEELGIGSDDIDIWCQMPKVDTSTGFEVFPYAGQVSESVNITPDSAEVADVVYVPVRVFVDQSSKRSITILKNGTTRIIDAYVYEGRVIWGASARIIANTINIVKEAA